MELALIEVPLVDDTVGESEFADALRPALLGWANEVAARPLGHFLNNLN